MLTLHLVRPLARQGFLHQANQLLSQLAAGEVPRDARPAFLGFYQGQLPSFQQYLDSYASNLAQIKEQIASIPDAVLPEAAVSVGLPKTAQRGDVVASLQDTQVGAAPCCPPDGGLSAVYHKVVG